MTLLPLPPSVKGVALPSRFTYPMAYHPHEVSVACAHDLWQRLQDSPWKDELMRGKMLGVLIVEDRHGAKGYLAAFSGTLGGLASQAPFVPPVYDPTSPSSYFQVEQAAISRLNRRIRWFQSRCRPTPLHQAMQKALARRAEECRESKLRRDRLRATLPPDLLAAKEPSLIRESQFEKARLKRERRHWQERIREAEAPLREIQHSLQTLREERQRRSQALQQWLFGQYRLLNARGERAGLTHLFAPHTPPSGAGDCCAPRLLQAAYEAGLKPRCMAEFWVGESPVGEVRHHLHFYEACRGKCRPILLHMLQGLDVEPNPLALPSGRETAIRVVYEDEALLVVHKPEGMLSQPGIEPTESVEQWLRRRYPDAPLCKVAHRLDMDTSGLLVVALREDALAGLQRQFASREVGKRYVALLSKPLPVGQEGDIDLPLKAVPHERPRQMVDRARGLAALTHYRVDEVTPEGYARVSLWPHTGRTHQLRLHCAHPQGLHAPIVGDRLYGLPGGRLMLQAVELSFCHPLSSRPLHFNEDAEF